MAKDVAFTSDERFLVTERNDVPTLVETDVNREIQTYDINEETMTAATFSPDEEKLYIATRQRNIYVFNSNLPQAEAANWEVYP